MKHTLVILLILAQAGVGSAVSALRAKSDRAVTVEAAPNPWLSLLATGWAIAGSPQKEQMSGLEKLEQQILKLAREGHFGHQPGNESTQANSQMAQAVSMLRVLILNMMQQVNQSNMDAQNMLNVLYAAFNNCVTPTVNTTVDPNRIWDLTLKNKKCLQNLTAVSSNSTLCVSQLQECLLTSQCCTDLVQDKGCKIEPPLPPTTVCDGITVCDTSNLDALNIQLQRMLQEYDDAWAACTLSKQKCHHRDSCDDEVYSTTVVTWQCSETQNIIETTYCGIAQQAQANWRDYSDCYEIAKANLLRSEAQQRPLLIDRKNWYIVLVRILCLLDALQASDVQAAVNKCIAATNDSPFGLKFPSEDPGLPVKQNCTTMLTNPTSPTFLNQYYTDGEITQMKAALQTDKCWLQLPQPLACPVTP